jgi:glycosyltransferase involved in cell wall biosynthesis
VSILFTPDTRKTATREEAVRIEPPSVRRVRRPFAIAVFNYGLPSIGQKRGGVDQVAHDLSNALADRGHAITVFTYDAAPPAARYRTRQLPLRGFATSRIGRAITMGYVGNLLALAPDYREFDVIIAHGDSLLLPLTGKPIVRVMHGSAREEARSATSLVRKALQYGVYLQEMLTARMQPGTVAVSTNTRQSNPRIQHVIPNGIDLRVFRPNPPARSSRPSILFVGALGGRKRGQWLIEQFREQVLPVYPDAELHMVCSPGEPQPGVRYHTGIAAADLVQLYQQAWVYASPSTYEGFGLPYLEAMACGTPVVASSNPGSREVLGDGRYGSVTTDDQFADAVLGLLGNAGKRQAMVTRGLQRARAYEIAGTAQAYEMLMEELISLRAA